MSLWIRIVQRDLRIAWRRRSDALSSLFFFVIVVSLFPLGVGPEPGTLRLMASGVLWVAALLATLLSLGRLFAADHQDGTLEQMLLAAEPLWLVVTAKICAHWLTSGLPLVLLSPLMGLQFGLEGGEIAVLTGALLLGTPVLSLIGAIGAAQTVGRCWQLPLQSGDSGVQLITNVQGSVATVGTFNVMVLRRLAEGRVPIANGLDRQSVIDVGALLDVYADSAFYVLIAPDSTSSGLPDVDFQVVNG